MTANPPAIPDYALTERAQVPEAFKWKASDLFADEAAWRREFAAVKALVPTLDTLAKGWTASPKAMGDFVARLDEIEVRGTRLMQYASLQGDMDLGDPRYQKMKGEIQAVLVETGARLAFMGPDILALGREKLEAYVAAEPRLAARKVGFLRTLRMKDHIMAEGEERVAATAGLFMDAPADAAGMLNNVDMPHRKVKLSTGEEIVLNTAAYNKHRASAVPADRRLVMEEHFKEQAQYRNTFASLLDASVKSHVFNARIRKYGSCLDAALYPEAIDPAVYRNLVSTVKAHLGPLQRLMKLRARMLGLPEMRYGDVYASAVKSVDRKFTYEEARDLVLKATAPLGPEYAGGIGQAFTKGWVDIYPNKGKQSGAYSSGVHGVHPFVKMNYDGSFHEVSTLAHELGHAMHSWLSDAAQPWPMGEYPIFLAEIASTFNENLLMHHMMDTIKDDTLKLYLLDSYLETLRGTLFRQTLFADFELAMHEHVEKGQSLTADWLDAKYLELTRLYYGHDAGVMRVDDYIKTEWSSIPHFYYNFYVYQYATGIVSSMALSEAALKDPAARDRYLAFLKSGGSRFPLETLKSAGVDLATPAPVEAALKAFDDMVGRMEALHARIQAGTK
ncbi:oligoendopeptidase F [Mesoterricola sediminis]|nr:oligoendopeptidase F [Mesoterricola sediminis]